MPLATLYSLQWYGPGLGAAVDQVSVTAVGTLKGLGGLRAVNATAPTAYARINLGKAITAAGSIAVSAYARPAARGRMAAVGKVNELSQDDVSGAITTTVIEDGLTLRDVLRLVLAATRGESEKNSLGGGNVEHIYKSNDGTKPRITAVVNAAGERSSVTVDPT